MAHRLVQLAREAIRAIVEEDKVIGEPPNLTEEMKEGRGVFVSLKKHGELRGCIGTVDATQPNIALEVIHNGISAATRDPRFPPVRPDELSQLSYSVDILSEPEPVKDFRSLDPKRYGVIVQSRGRRGLLLPDLEGVDTVESQLSIAKQKAGIARGESVDIYRFEVRRYR